jgi:hypothetical protein
LIAQSVAQKKDFSAEKDTKHIKLGDMNDYGDFLTADGAWRPDDLTDKNELAFDAVVRLECYKTGGKQIVGSDAYCVEATAQIIGGGLPNIDVLYFPVKRWDKDMVIASDSPTNPFPICTWSQITISLHEKSIMLTDTRKLGKGHEGINNTCEKLPLSRTYHLMDKTEEITRRQLRRSQQKKP